MLKNRTLPTETIIVDGITIHHAVIGEGVPIVMLHGWGAEIKLIYPLAEQLVKLGYRCYMPDLSGFGASPEPPTAWTIFDYAELVRKYIHQQELERVHLFGHSFGGRLCMILGAKHPQLVHKITLADSAGLRPKQPLMSQLRLKTYKMIRDGLRNIGFKTLADQLASAYNKRYGSSDFNAVSGVMRQTFVNVVNQDLRDYAKQIQAPTLLVWGDQDHDTPLSQAHELEQLIPDAGLVVFAGAGHYSYLEKPHQTAQAMHALFSHQ
jgi:pimeloyl-ACP methyl ester carboxylesterase